MEISNKLLFLLIASICIISCSNPPADKGENKQNIVKGLYSFGPESRSFINCEDGSEYWVADSSKRLELAYNDLGFEKPYTPVYIEVECRLVKSDTSISPAGNYDSTMVVTKLLKITKDIPPGPCNQ